MLFRDPDIYPLLHYDLGNSGVNATCLMGKVIECNITSLERILVWIGSWLHTPPPTYSLISGPVGEWV